MDMLIKWTFSLAASMMLMSTGYAWNIASIGRVNGPSIHSTYFLTSNNAPFPVHAQAYVGSLVNGTCQFNAQYDLGVENIKTGDVIDIDAFRLKSLVGMGYTCMSVFYTNRQVVMETIILNSDGINYTNSIPGTAEVTIL